MDNFVTLLPFILSSLLSAVIGAYALYSGNGKGVGFYAIYALSQAVRGLGYVLEINAQTLEGKEFWNNFQYVTIFLLANASLLFSLTYMGYRVPRIKWIWAGTLVATIAVLVLAYTDHPLISVNPELRPNPPFNNLYYNFGIIGLTSTMYSVVAGFVAALLLLYYTFKVQSSFRTQTAIITFGIMFPIIAAVLSLMVNFKLAGQSDTTPLMFGVANLIIGWGLFRYKLFSLVPIARDRVVESMVNGVVVFNQELVIVDANPAAYKMFAKVDLLGTTLDQTLPDYTTFIMENRHLEWAGIEHEVQINDQALHYELSLSQIKDPYGEYAGNIMVVRDVTERFKAQQEIQARTIQLEQAQHKIQTLYEEQVKVSEHLRALDQMKSQFLASMSHELRTPLNAILNFTQFMNMGMLGPVTEKQQDALGKVLNSGQHLLSLINDVLDMTKIQAGMMTLFVEADINVNKEVETVCAAVESLFKGKSVQFVRDIDSPLPTMVGDRRRVRQILLNLLSNAVKFTEEGSVTLSVKHRGEDLMMMVSDTGPGISLEEQPIIFEPFRQTEAGIQHAGGTGLGLPISRKLAEAHGGKLWVESAVGEGSTFFVQLPLCAPEVIQLLNQANAESEVVNA